MSATKNIAKNTILLTVGMYSGRLLALFLRKKMSPILGPDGIGLWTFALSITGIMQTISNFGLGNLITREISKSRIMTWPLFWTTLKIRWMLSAVCISALVGYTQVSGMAELNQAVVLLMGLAIFIEGTGLACDSVLQAHEKVQFQTAGQIASAVLYFALGWWWLSAGYGIMGLVWANLASRVGRLIIMIPLMIKRTGPWQRQGPGGSINIRYLMRMGFPIFLATTFATIYSQIDSVMLMNMIGDAGTGIYGQGRQALSVLLLLPWLFGLAFFPSMARYGQKSAADAARLGERAMRFILVGIVPISLFVMFVSEPIINFFENSGRFEDSIMVMKIGVWGLPLHAVAVVFNRLLMTAEKEKHFIFIGLVPMLSNFVLNLVLIPKFSYFGAAIATVVSLMINAGMHVVFLYGTEFMPPMKRAVLGPMLAVGASWAAAAGILKFLAPSWNVGWQGLPLDKGWGPFLISSVLMLLIYPVFLWVGRVLRKDDLNLLRDLK
ncbi:MAG: flippase [bacterium]|nr:flippase [bacterium]